MKRPTANRRLAELGFSPPVWVEGATSLAEVLPAAGQPGIYVLHFADGWKYVGQSVRVTRRFLQHLSNFDDIRAVSFLTVDQGDLSAGERQVVAELEAIGVRLRNMQLVSFASSSSTFAEVMAPEEQERWLGDLTFVDLQGARPSGLLQREKLQARYERWRTRFPQEEIASFLALYLAAAIPVICCGEQTFWSLSCLVPRGHPTWRAACRININMQEVLCVWQDDEGVGAYLQLAASPLRTAFGPGLRRLSERCSGIEVCPDLRYKPGGQDQLRIIADSLQDATEFIRLEPVVRSLRRFNLSLMRKGKCFWAASHCFQLADACFGILGRGAQ